MRTRGAEKSVRVLGDGLGRRGNDDREECRVQRRAELGRRESDVFFEGGCSGVEAALFVSGCLF